MTATIIIPIHNAHDSLRRCLTALDDTLPAATDVLLCEDASTDDRILALLDDWKSRTKLSVEVRHHARNLGFPAACNDAFERTKGDVILLNSDTRPAWGWYQALLQCAARENLVASITPWSNNATICSFPVRNEGSPMPDDVDAIGRAAARLPSRDYVELPTAVGFCMWISRVALERCADFDASTFGHGYGEENDWCIRTTAHGWRHLHCHRSYVGHEGGASFSPLGISSGGVNLDRLLSRWPDYNARVADFITRDALASWRQALVRELGIEVDGNRIGGASDE